MAALEKDQLRSYGNDIEARNRLMNITGKAEVGRRVGRDEPKNLHAYMHNLGTQTVV